jgi:hypothetical protein
MKQKTIGWLIFAGGLVAMGWLWWRRQSGSGAASPLAGGAGQLSIGQFGANIKEDSTPEVVALALDYAATTLAGCWLPLGGDDGNYVYKNSVSGEIIRVPLTMPQPSKIC